MNLLINSMEHSVISKNFSIEFENFVTKNIDTYSMETLSNMLHLISKITFKISGEIGAAPDK